MSGRNNNNKSSSSSSNIPPSTNSIVKPFGGMHGFMNSYGIKQTQEGYEEAKEIINAFKQADMQQNNQSSNGNSSSRR
jgi:hypothetical protein